MHRRLLVTTLMLAAALAPERLRAQTPAAPAVPGQFLDETIPPGANFDKAEFKFWLPDGAATLRGVVVLVPGSNGDGRPMAEDTFWQQFAQQHSLALLACRFTDKPHDQSFIEDYVNVSRGSGQALLDVIATLGTRAKHPETATVPLFLWGMSAGGQFNYEFAAWKPERVGAFIVNKGGIYYSALVSKATRQVPALLFVGEKDLQSRIDTITGLFAVNRRGGALWALVVEPGAAHVVGKSKELGALLFEEMLAKPSGAGFIGDLKTFEIKAAATPGTPGTPDAWLQTERLANAWKAVVSGR
jgi:poly(3-hydroxybutyrate) depolymerase